MTHDAENARCRRPCAILPVGSTASSSREYDYLTCDDAVDRSHCRQSMASRSPRPACRFRLTVNRRHVALSATALRLRPGRRHLPTGRIPGDRRREYRTGRRPGRIASFRFPLPVTCTEEPVDHARIECRRRTRGANTRCPRRREPLRPAHAPACLSKSEKSSVIALALKVLTSRHRPAPRLRRAGGHPAVPARETRRPPRRGFRDCPPRYTRHRLIRVVELFQGAVDRPSVRPRGRHPGKP